MTSRLDRLLTLLTHGSTPATRRAAAAQIGEIQKYFPYELQTLLWRVHSCLRNKDWETRAAAAVAVEAIVKNVPEWDPVGTDTPTAGSGGDNTGDLMFTFETFDLNAVLQRGAELVGSSGVEYEDDDADLDPRERLRLHRSYLSQKLGLDNKTDNVEGLIESDDVKRATTTRDATKDAKMTEDLAGLSARERNRFKRLAKQQAKTKSRDAKVGRSTSIGSVDARESTVVAQTDPTKIVVESKADAQQLFATAEEWPLQPRVEELCQDLFASDWCVRQGACLGLREIMKIHGKGAGRSADVLKGQQDLSNQRWLADLAIRLICVLALDRFGDYISDQVVAPVRDVAAQALGAVLKHMSVENATCVVNLLSRLMQEQAWEIRHGGLLGIKYIVAVRPDIAELLIDQLLALGLLGLSDPDDAVRGAAADALHPMADSICVHFSTEKLHELLGSLWEALLELDSLSASTASVLKLLAALLASVSLKRQEAMAVVMPASSNHVARLWPFFRHTLSTVRGAVLEALQTLLQSTTGTADWLSDQLAAGMTHLMQNILVEERAELLTLTKAVWTLTLTKSAQSALIPTVTTRIASWLALITAPEGCPLPPEHVLRSQMDDEVVRSQKGKRKDTHNNNNNNNEFVVTYVIGGVSQLSNPDPYAATHARIAGAQALGQAIACLPTQPIANDLVLHHILPLLHANSVVGCVSAVIVVTSWESNQHSEAVYVPDAIRQRLAYLLENKVSFSELNAVFAQMVSDAAVVLNLYKGLGLSTSEIQASGVKDDGSTLNYNECQKLIDAIPNWNTKLRLKVAAEGSVMQAHETQRIRLQHSMNSVNLSYNSMCQTLSAAVADAIVHSKSLPERANTLLQRLMSSLRSETTPRLQQRSACALALLMQLLLPRTPCPNDKVITNLCNMLAKGSSVPPQYLQSVDVILTTELARISDDSASSQGRGQKRKALSDDSEEQSSTTSSTSLADSIEYRGACFSLEELCKLFGDKMIVQLPNLWNAAIDPLVPAVKELESNNVKLVTATINALFVLQSLTSFVVPSIAPKLLESLPTLRILLTSRSSAIRMQAALTLADIAKVPCLTLGVMEFIISSILPELGNMKQEINRKGCVEAMYHLSQRLGLAILPYIVLLVIPIIGCMSDFNADIRLIVSASFAGLLRLIPLEQGLPDPVGMSETLVLQKSRERKFLDQLLDSSSLEKYRIPVRINAELRSYQQAGVDWLNFLTSYKLHGILCDDMGLGKTLQTICIIGSVVYERAQRFLVSPTPDNDPLPAVVVCPTTLTSHWHDEVGKFCPSLTPLLYVGSRAQRDAIRLRSFQTASVIIMSYETARSDIEALSQMRFCYCVLDEGHVIKNGKSMMAKAVKRIQAVHRLILSGTPIQNNVLELWSLFDFLMPGFLGTERQFNEAYSKPILASKSTKASPKDQAAGTLALESLHRQVLPFLLRRLKENVLDDLLPKIIQDIHCDLTPIQRTLYEAVSQSSSSGTGNSQHIFAALQYLRDVCNHPALVLKPAHPLYAAIQADLKKQDTTIANMHHSSKLVALQQLLEDCGLGGSNERLDELTEDGGELNPHRLLIFAQHSSMLDLVENSLLKAHMKHLKFLRLDGSVPPQSRQGVVNNFNNDVSINILLLTTHVGGLGLNLTGADTVVFLDHDWNPSRDLQAMDRAHRIGQKRVVNVYRMITRGTLEEKIMGLQKFKLNIANTVVSQENSSLRSMGTAQLLDLFHVSDLPESNGAKEGSNSAVDAAMNDAVDGLGDLCDKNSTNASDEYADYNVESFLKSMGP